MVVVNESSGDINIIIVVVACAFTVVVMVMNVRLLRVRILPDTSAPYDAIYTVL